MQNLIANLFPRLIVAVDGYAAAGKGTLARRLAGALGLPYLDTGLLYRAVAKQVLAVGCDVSNSGLAVAIATRLSIDDIALAGLRSPEIDRVVPSIARIPEVRAALLDFQRNFGHSEGAVLDGRDIGTVVFPDADVKFFVTASLEARALRRHLELQRSGITVSLNEVTVELKARDGADRAREAAPLRPAEDAVPLDTTTLDPDQVFTKAMDIIRTKVG